jgi:hypothetical protein
MIFFRTIMFTFSTLITLMLLNVTVATHNSNTTSFVNSQTVIYLQLFVCQPLFAPMWPQEQNMKRKLSYFKNQFVPRSKHFSSRL